MKPISRLALSLVMLFVGLRSAQAQKVYRVGALVAEDQFVPAIDGFKKKMSELGYLESKNIKYELQNAKGDQETLKKMAQALIEKRPDLIVTSSTTATVPVAKLTRQSNLPVVFLSAGDPLRLVKSYFSSGNNMTGITSASVGLIAKRLELLKTISPGMKRVILLADPAGTNYEQTLKAAQAAVDRLGLQATELKIDAKNVDEVKQQTLRIRRSLGDGLLVPLEATLVAATEEIAQQAG